MAEGSEITKAQSPVPGRAPEQGTRRRRAYHRSGLYRAELPPAVAATIAERRKQLIADLGGDEAVTTTMAALVEVCLRSWALLDAVDGFLLTSLPCPVDRRHRRVWPVVMERGRLAANLEQTLARLGLERRPKPVPDFESFIREAERAGAEPSPPEPPADDPFGDFMRQHDPDWK